MLRWALVFLILAVGAALVGFGKTAAGLVEHRHGVIRRTFGHLGALQRVAF